MRDPDVALPEEFSEAVGDAILIWQPVESSAAHLFMHLLASRNAGAMSVFYHIKNFSTRLEMMNIAARFLFFGRGRKRLLAQWKKLSERMYAASALRNRLAHFEVDDGMTAEGWKLTLGPSRLDWSQLDPSNPTRWKERQSRRVVTYSQIKSGIKEFRKLGDDLNKFALRVAAINNGKPLPKFGVKDLPLAQETDEGRLLITGHQPPGAPPRRPIKEIERALKKKRPSRIR